jgi:ABC-type glycerol-3-phosphate transport system permease component
MGMRTRGIFAGIGKYTLLGLLLVFLLFPIYWALNTSFKREGEVNRLPQTYLPRNFTIQAYLDLIEIWKFGPTTVNTLIIALSSALGATVLGTLAGYGFNRFYFPGKGLLFGFLVVSMALPGMVVIGPVFMAYKDLGLLDTKLGITMIDLASGLTFSVYYLYAFFQTIPIELDDAARIDGCSWLGTLYHVILPLSAPGVAITIIVLFINGWNEFLFANVLTIGERSRVLTVKMMEIPAQFTMPYHRMAAGGIMTLIPVAIIVLIAQRQIVEGLVAGSLKGA